LSRIDHTTWAKLQTRMHASAVRPKSLVLKAVVVANLTTKNSSIRIFAT